MPSRLADSARQPPLRRKPGDVREVEIDKMDVPRQPVVDEQECCGSGERRRRCRLRRHRSMARQNRPNTDSASSSRQIACVSETVAIDASAPPIRNACRLSAVQVVQAFSLTPSPCTKLVQ